MQKVPKIDTLDALGDAIFYNLDNNLDKVKRCLARYSLRAITTSQPTNRAPNEPARPGKNANFWHNMAVLGQKILIFTGEI